MSTTLGSLCKNFFLNQVNISEDVALIVNINQTPLFLHVTTQNATVPSERISQGGTTQ